MKSDFKKFLQEISQGKIRFNQKAYIFLFCLLLSVFFWFLSSLSDLYTTTLRVPLKYDALAKDFILTEKPGEEVRILVRGSGFELLGEQMSLNRKAVSVNLNLAKADLQENRYFILTKYFQSELRENLDADIELLDIIDDSLFLSTQKRVKKSVKVNPKLKIDFKKGYKQRGEVVVSPEKVEVSGPADYIEQLEFIETEELVVKDLSDSLNKELVLMLPDSVNGLNLDYHRVDLLIPVEKYTEKVIELKVNIENKSKEQVQIRSFPDEVEVTFLLPLSKYNQLNESRVKAVVMYDESTVNQKKLKVNIEGLPDYATLSKIKPEAVEYIIRK